MALFGMLAGLAPAYEGGGELSRMPISKHNHDLN